MELSRSLLKDFADLTNEPKGKKVSNQVRGTIKSVGDAKYVQLDGSQSLTPISEVVDAQDGDRVIVLIENHTATVLGNFTFAPSARKEDEAINKADDAQNSADNAEDAANDANNKADDAVNKAQEAGNKADQAMEAAEGVSDLANEAKENAQEAINKADSASQNAEEAKQSAADAAASATTAREEAAQAQQAIANAQGEMNKINTEITNVKGDINTALEDLANQAAETEAIKETMEVNYAKKTDVSTVEANLKTEISKKVGELQTTVEENYAAKTEIVNLEGKLQTQITQNADNLSSTATKVEKLESDTAEAQKQVDQAIAKADAAQTAASTAQTQASAAQSAADAAQADATAAQTAATAAQNKANEAQALADTADKAVQAAQSDLNEAKQNLTNVTNRVGATEEEIAAAQAKVDAAQEAVDNALADAAEANLAATNAQKAADQAKLDAQEAQTAADNAQLKADNAQAVADKAAEDADQALKDVAALTLRVTSAETKIEQNSEQIALTATKVDEIGSRKVVTESVPYFYLSTSSTQLVGGSWSTTPPTWREGTYYWQKTVTTYFDGTASESTPICITGNTGADGTGVTILGSYDTESELTQAHPTGSPGDAYMVSGDLYVWDANKSKWKNVGRIQGDPGVPGDPGKGIQSTAVTYQASASGTTVPTGNWTTSIPSVAANQYLWSRTVITYTDGSSSTSYSIGKMGATGGKGDKGDDGKGIKSTAVTYQASTSGTTVPNGAWSSTIPSVAANQYLWTRTIITYTDDTTSTSYSIGKMGEKGEKGDDGKTYYTWIKYADSPTTGMSDSPTGKEYIGLAYNKETPTESTTYSDYTWAKFKGDQGVPGPDGTTYYTWIKYATSATGAGMSDDPAGKSYIGIAYNKTTATESNTASDYTWSLMRGEDGADGRSIVSMTVEFYLSTSKTTQTGGSWTTTVPEWKKGKYLWTRTKIVYENPTSTEYTTPVCDTSWEAANDVADDLHNNYYNKTETEAKIQVESEKITSSVTETITEEITKVEGNIENAQTAADDASAIASSTETRVTVAESTIEQLSNAISSLIVDENGTTMMTQTSEGWRFDMGSINSQLSSAKDQLNDLSGTVDGVEETIGNLNDLANDLSAKTAYITMTTDDAGDPCIELGKSDNDFKVRITNTSIDFMEGGSRIAYLSNSSLYIEKAIIKNELQIGEGSGFVWKTRSNGHMGLRWEEGES